MDQGEDYSCQEIHLGAHEKHLGLAKEVLCYFGGVVGEMDEAWSHSLKHPAAAAVAVVVAGDIAVVAVAEHAQQGLVEDEEEVLLPCFHQ